MPSEGRANNTTTVGIKQIIRFFESDIWQMPTEGLSPIKRMLLAVVKTVALAVRFFTTKRVMTHASALTYSTLLAIVPIVAVLFAIARGFGYSKYIEMWFRDVFASQPQAADVIVGFVNSYLVHTKSGIFLGVGLLFMLYTVLMLVRIIEQTFNKIWQVKHERSIFRMFTDYLALFFIFPILVVVSSGLSIFLATMADRLPDVLLVGTAVRKLLDLSPYILMSLLFIGLYVFVPNTHVKVRNAIVPGILAGIAMQWLQFFYIHSQIWMTGYNAIYGSFAALPLFMLWVQISWTICLFGAELTYTSQYLDYYDYDVRTSDVSHRYRLMLAALLMSRVCRRFADGQKAPTADELRKETSVPIRIINDLLYQLVEAHLVIEVSSDEKGETSRYIPSESLDNLSLGVMIDRLEARGSWLLDLPMDELFSPLWVDAVEMRTNYLKTARTVRLEDLAKS
ncbi:MAG: YihY/virulence factor BrkB family protein [Prevotella sp.]|nr:YihY/virulence factor BrkB family protein [Prevotella sp.]